MPRGCFARAKSSSYLLPPSLLWSSAMCQQLPPTQHESGGCCGVQDRARDWKQVHPASSTSLCPRATPNQADAHPPGSQQFPQAPAMALREPAFPFLRPQLDSSLGPATWRAPACPQFHDAQPRCEMAACRDMAGSQIHQETSVLPFPLHMHQAGKSPPSQALVPS